MKEELVIEGLDTEKGYLYCGGREQYLTVLRIQFEDSKEIRKRVQDEYAGKDWKKYIITVHSIKSSMMSIGAVVLSELAKGLELAGKAGNLEYIYQRHDEMLREYDRVYQILYDHPLINPPKVSKVTEQELPELQRNELCRLVDAFEEAAFSLEEQGMLDVIEKLRQYTYQGQALEEVLAPVKRKVEMLDYMSAFGVLEKLKEV